MAKYHTATGLSANIQFSDILGSTSCIYIYIYLFIKSMYVNSQACISDWG